MCVCVHAHTFVSVNFPLTSITLILTKQYFLFPNPKPTRYRKPFLSPNPKPTRYRKPVCIVTLQINIIDYFEYIYIYFPSWRPQAGPHRTFGVKNVRFYYPCGDIWSPQCSINKYTHTHTHTQNLTISTRFLMEFKHCFSHQSQR